MKLKETFIAVQLASRKLALTKEDIVNKVLNALSRAIEDHMDTLLAANGKDLALMDRNSPKYDRLQLDEKRLEDIAADIRNVALLPSPLHLILENRDLPNGLNLKKVSVPFGVIGVIYEARPNVSFDVFSLCLKSGNACILKGGSDAKFSNEAIVKLIHEVLNDFGIDEHVVELLPPGHDSAAELLHANEYIDLIIPRGGRSLINFVRQESTVPVIETGAGICHTYFDKDGDLKKGSAIVNNAKTRRVSVCNALDCLLVHEARIDDLYKLCEPLQKNNVIIYADSKAYKVLRSHYPESLLKEADETSFGTEFLDYKMSVKTVSGIEEAVEHILNHGSRHSECIVTENEVSKSYFRNLVDAACVYINAPTSFTDGAQFGLGAEIGISTQKLHARGPMALREITTYKWIVEGNGQIRK